MFRIGLIGAGRMGQTHLRALKLSSSVRVEAVVEPRQEVTAGLASEGYRVFESTDQLLQADFVDGFLVTVPSGSHLSTVRKLTEAKLPILCEKPAGLTVSEAKQIKSEVEAAGVRLQIGYWRRFLPELRTLKLQIEAGQLGRLLLIQANQWDSSPPSAEFRNTSGGIFRDMSVHEIDQIRWLTGMEILSASASELMSPDEGISDQDAGVIDMKLSDSTLALATLGRYFNESDYVGIEVFGTNANVRLDLLDAKLGDQPQIEALAAQAEAFSLGVDQNAANIDDAIAALSVINEMSYK